jgi:hypothetical protein
MSKRLTIHIGTFKTGSTTIQNFLARNALVLEREGLGYCHGKDFPYYFKFGDYPLEQLAYTDRSPIIRHYLGKAHVHSLVLSSELFSRKPTGKKISHLKMHLEALGVNAFRIVCYLRRQDLLIESLYTQCAKKGEPAARPEDYLSDTTYTDFIDYAKFLALWGEVFGNENLIVRPFEKGQFYGGDLIRDFVHVLDLDHLYERCAVSTAPDEANVRPNSVMVAMHDLYNRANPGLGSQAGRLRHVFEACGLADLENPSDGTCFLTYAQRREILESFRASNACVARAYLDRDDGRLFHEEPEPYEDAEVFHGITLEEFVPNVLHALVRMHERRGPLKRILRGANQLFFYRMAKKIESLLLRHPRISSSRIYRKLERWATRMLNR